jgi:RES domain-containing protein
MPTFYRIVGSHRAATALDGEGAKRMGGRWNPQGIAAVYLTESRALAALEIMVHFGREVVNASWAIIEVEVPSSLIASISSKDLPHGWNDRNSLAVPQQFGRKWLEAGKSTAILLPSAIISQESILLLNPLHPDFTKISSSHPTEFFFDARLG